MHTSSESSGLSFRLHKFENVTDSDWTFHVSDEVSFIGFFTSDKSDFDLGDTTSGSGSAQQLSDSGLDWLWLHVDSIIRLWFIILLNYFIF